MIITVIEVHATLKNIKTPVLFEAEWGQTVLFVFLRLDYLRRSEIRASPPGPRSNYRGSEFWRQTEVMDSNASGGKTMNSVPDNSQGANIQMEYDVNFVKRGVHQVWIRGRANPRTGDHGSADSVNVGLNSSEGITVCPSFSSFG